jgi:predicted TIM-barrel fold metal-dependent hydrolase
MITAMDAAGVDGALLVSQWAKYQFDPSYAIEVRADHPDRFAMVTPVDHHRPDVGEVIAEWARTPGAVGIRTVLLGEESLDAGDPGLGRVLTAAADHRLPLCVLCTGQLEFAAELARRHPDTQLVVDHLGLPQASAPPPLEHPFADLPSLLALARWPNIAIKVTGAATMSREPFPFADLWEPLDKIFDAFGIERCMWGTDWTRATQVVSYPDAVAAFRDADHLSPADHQMLMGGSLERIFGWAPSSGPLG